MDEIQDGQRILYTVGHSNRTLDLFLGLLTQHSIDVLVDTRPHSRYIFLTLHVVLKLSKAIK